MGYVLGVKPYFVHLHVFALQSWNPSNLKKKPHENSFFFFKFSCKEDCAKVLVGGSWLFDGQPIILKRWRSDIKFDRDLFTSLLVWVRIPRFQVQFWSKAVLSEALSTIGKPIVMDDTTASQDRIEFARCCVEVTTAKTLPGSIKLLLPSGDRVEQTISYEWLPHRCVRSLSFGHKRPLAQRPRPGCPNPQQALGRLLARR